MSLTSVSSLSFQAKQGNTLISTLRDSPALSSSSLTSVYPSSPTLSFPPRKHGRAFRVSASSEINSVALTGVVFEPFAEIKKEELDIPVAPQVSLARQKYTDDCEAAINQQINVEYNVSYVYRSLYAYFDRDNIALKGLAKFFKESSEEEREQAEKLMEYQNIRGGRVKLHSILMTPSEFEHADKGDALYAMELALSMEKLTNEKLLSLHNVAEQNNDAEWQKSLKESFCLSRLKPLRRYQNMLLN